MSKEVNNVNNETNLIKSTTNDQIENNNDVNDLKLASVDISCDSCKYNPKNTTKKEQFLNLFGVKTGEEFYIKSDKDRGSYLIYHFTEQLSLLARSSNDKNGIMTWCSPSIGKLLENGVELIKWETK